MWRVVKRVGVVGVEHRTVGDRSRQIRGIAAARRMIEADAGDHSVVVEPHVVIDAKIVPLAGHLHVVVAVEPELGRPPGPGGDQRRDPGEHRRLAFLAAEAAAHPPHLDGDGVVGNAEDLGDGVLDLARMLRRGVDQHVAPLAGDRIGDLTFQVEVILAADDNAAFDPPRRPVDCGLGVSEMHLMNR